MHVPHACHYDLTVHDTGTSIVVLGTTQAGRRFIEDHPESSVTSGEPVLYQEPSQLDALFDLIDLIDLATQTTF